MDNVSKILYYLEPFAKESIMLDGQVIDCKVNSIKLSEDFFCVDGCNMCGHCCPPEHNVYTEFEYQKILECTDDDILEYGRLYGEENGLPLHYIHSLKSDIKKQVHNINGKDVNLYEFNKPYPMMYLDGKGKEVTRCYFVHKRPDGKVVCGIHPVRSITCRMPHLRVYNSSANNTSLHTSQFGRNWALGCKIAFKSPETEEEFNASKADKLDKLQYLLKIADDINVPTYLPEVIKYVESVEFSTYHESLNVDILHIRKVKKLF